MAVALRTLPMGEVALRHDKMQMVPGPRHRDIEQAALFFQLGRCAGAKVGWHAAIDDIQHIDRLPLLSLRGMDGRQDQIVFIEQRNASLIAGRVGRIERKFGEETLAGGIAACDLFELDEIGAARVRVLVDALKMRLVPETYALDVGGPLRISEVADGP